MAEVAKLVTPPTAVDKVKAEIVEALQQALAEAERGELNCLVLIKGRNDGKWAESRSSTAGYCETIGRLEIVKQNWIKWYLEHE